MSEYISVNPEYTDDPNVVNLETNLDLAPDGDEHYPDRESGDEGSPLAQFLFGIEGLEALDIRGGMLMVRRAPEIEWHALIDEITNALREFFL